ncbi:MAG TPA: ABC transporter substrate-binding protein [Desulfomonilaceae bacterium]|nr:ABC transporter substrate-binding protein [Desulfomonilaceae bacterium]
MVRFFVILSLVTSLFFNVSGGFVLAAQDTLAGIQQRGTLVAGVKDSLPPFGYVDEATRRIVGYDADFLKAIADKLGVKLELKAVTSASRMPQLMEKNIDIIAATMTNTPERSQQIDFSYTYFVTAQKFLARKGAVRSLADLEGKKIATAKGSNSEQNARKALPSATILSFDDYPQAFLALCQGKVFAVTTDEAILMGILNKSPNKDQFEIPNLKITREPYAIGVRKGDTAFLDLVNNTLLEMESSGQAKEIFQKWFGPDSSAPLDRNFVISPGK